MAQIFSLAIRVFIPFFTFFITMQTETFAENIVSSNTEEIQSNYDVVIIGGGPAGLKAAQLCSEKKISYLLIESRSFLGGHGIENFPDKTLWNVSGVSPDKSSFLMKFSNLIQNLVSHIDQTRIKTNEKYIKYTYSDHKFTVYTDKSKYSCKNLIIATGYGEAILNKPDIKNLSIYENKQIFYFLIDPKVFKGKKIVVVGAGQSAIDAVHQLASDNTVYWVTRSSNNHSHGSSCNIIVVQNAEVALLNGDAGVLHSVTLKSKEATKDLECDYVFFCLGYKEQKNETPEHKNLYKVGVAAGGGNSIKSAMKDVVKAIEQIQKNSKK